VALSRYCLDTSAYSYFKRGDPAVVALRRAGTPIPTNDVWIAASAFKAGATVLTYDHHFDTIQRVGSIILPIPDAAD